MPTSSPSRLQLGLLEGGIALCLLCLGLFNTVQAQPGFPGRPNFPQPNIPQPPNMPRPNMPGMGGPQVPNMPGMGGPRMPNMPGMGGPQMPNLPGPQFGGFETVYTCAKCNVEIGRGMFAPASATCPKCGLVYRNGVAIDNGRAKPPVNGGNAFPPVNGGIQFPPGQQVNVPNAGLPNINTEINNNPPLPPVNISSPNETNSWVPVTVVAPPSSNRVLYIIGGVVLALLVILGMVLAILHTNSKSKPVRKVRSSRSTRSDDEDFDD